MANPLNVDFCEVKVSGSPEDRYRCSVNSSHLSISSVSWWQHRRYQQRRHGTVLVHGSRSLCIGCPGSKQRSRSWRHREEEYGQNLDNPLTHSSPFLRIVLSPGSVMHNFSNGNPSVQAISSYLGCGSEISNSGLVKPFSSHRGYIGRETRPHQLLFPFEVRAYGVKREHEASNKELIGD